MLPVALLLGSSLIASVLIFRNWRRGVYGLLLYLPVGGLLTNMLYPAPPVLLLLKDFIFVIPTYVAFGVWITKHRGLHRSPGLIAAVAPMALLATIVVAQAFNPGVKSIWVTFIGLKVWLFYWPFYFVGREFFGTSADVQRFSRAIVVSSLLPAVFGIVQLLVYYQSGPEAAYRLYAGAAPAATQGFFATDLGSGVPLARMPGSFAFVTQQVSYILSVLPLAYLVWRQSARAVWRGIGLIAMLALLAAAFGSGVRAAFVVVPGLLLIAVILEGRGKFVLPALSAICAVAVFVVVTLLDTSFADLQRTVSELASDYVVRVQLDEFRSAMDLTTLGLGTGLSTGPARYAEIVGGRAVSLLGFENFYGKAWAELGAGGFVATVLVFATTIMSGLRQHGRIRDPLVRSFSAAIVAFLVVEVLFFWKGAFIDYDPVNVMFWFYAGVVASTSRIETRDASTTATIIPTGVSNYSSGRFAGSTRITGRY